MRLSMWIVIVLMAGGLAIALYYFLDRSSVFKRDLPESVVASDVLIPAPGEAFPQNYSITVEDTEDFPADPGQLHPARFEVLSTDGDKLGGYEAAGFKRGGAIQATPHHIYYLDTDDRVVKEAVTGDTLKVTQVADTQLGGFFAVDLGETRLAWSRSILSPDGNKAELVLATRHNGEITERVLISQTFEGRRAFVPLAWTDDGESLFYTIFDFDEGVVPRGNFLNLYQLHVEALLTDADALADEDIKPNSIAFPGEDAVLVAFDAVSGDLLFQDGSKLLFMNIAGGAEDTFSLPEGMVATSAVFSVGQVGVVAEDSAGVAQIFFLDTVTGSQESFPIEGEHARLVGFSDGFVVTREGPTEMRGTFQLSRQAEGPPVELKLSDRLSVVFK